MTKRLGKNSLLTIKKRSISVVGDALFYVMVYKYSCLVLNGHVIINLWHIVQILNKEH